MFLKVLSYPERVFSMQLFSIAYGQPHVEANSLATFAEKQEWKNAMIHIILYF